jgi:hypothetical protein
MHTGAKPLGFSDALGIEVYQRHWNPFRHEGLRNQLSEAAKADDQGGAARYADSASNTPAMNAPIA